MPSTISSFLILILVAACANPVTKAVNKVKYSAYEAVGMEKRDLFKRDVKNLKDVQLETGKAFKDALTQLKEVYGFDGGNLENEYEKLKNSYDDTSARASEVRERVAKLDQVANDLFAEWKTEISSMSAKDLKAKSSKKLSETQAKYRNLQKHLAKSEKSMRPVLAKLHDQVIFFKHNLNAQAMAGLKAESNEIQRDIEALLKDVEKSSKEAEAFIETL